MSSIKATLQPIRGVTKEEIATLARGPKGSSIDWERWERIAKGDEEFLALVETIKKMGQGEPCTE